MSAEDMDIDTDDGSDDGMVGVEESGTDGPAPPPLPDVNPHVPNSNANQPAAAVPATTSTTKRKPSRQVSIAHDDIVAGKLVLAHVDVETTAGSDKEIIQLSCVMADYHTKEIIGEFDQYVQPPKDTDWDLSVCQDTHKILPNDERIIGAATIKEVWPKFVEFCESGIGAGGKVGAFVAWNGKTDLESFFRITEYTYKDELFMPKGYNYFIDPMTIIKGYTRCKLHDKNRGDGQNKGYALDATYQAAFGEDMKGAHSSIVDARAQHKIVSDSRVHPYLDRNRSVEKVTEIWSAKFKRMNAARAEITRPVPVGYTDGGNEEFEPSWANSYEGPLGGGQAGPSSAALTACDGRDLAAVFLSFITVSMLASISVETNRYGNEQWVRPVSNEEYHSINEANAEEGGNSGNGEEEGDGGERRSSRKTAISIGYDFYVYTGKENDPASATQIVERLLALDPELVTNSKGRVMFTDNYYTSEELETKLYEDYGMLLVGTVKLTKKLSRTVADFAFHRLSNAAKKLVSRGWTRTAQKAVTGTNNNTARIVQCTTWMDRKQVGILHNYMVGEPGDFQTMRWDATLHERVPVSSHKIIPEYIRRMRGVDRADRSMADYDISLKSNRYYLRIVFYTINAAIVCMWIICLNVATTSARTKDPWKKYTRSEGRLKWTIDLGHALIAKGIKMDWGDIHDNTKRPKWIRQQAFLPCDCGLCFFCTENLTGPTGPPTASPRKHRRPPSPPPADNTSKHTKRPVRLFDNALACGECVNKGRKRPPKKGERVEGVEYCRRSRNGCSHPNCKGHPICNECWINFKHNK